VTAVPAGAPAERSGRALASAVRAELAIVSPARACCRRAEAAAFAGLGRRALPSRRVPLARLALRLERATSGVAAFDWDAGAEHCRIAWLRGLFLARGSLSLAGGRAHLEFVVPADSAEPLAGRLRAMGLPAAPRVRRGRGVVTWKSGETIATFLRLVGARAALLDLEADRVARTLRSDLNRALNAEAANLGRTVEAARRQLEAIERLEAEGRLAGLPRPTALVARARREAPEATLGELAEATGSHRSLVQRELRRIVGLAAEDA
jgi:DNA-binding protein WhiA